MVNCRYIKTDETGKITESCLVSIHDIPVVSTEIIPKGCGRYARAFVIDKMDIAICDGNDTWYVGEPGKVVSAKAGQPWSDLFG